MDVTSSNQLVSVQKEILTRNRERDGNHNDAFDASGECENFMNPITRGKSEFWDCDERIDLLQITFPS